MYIYTYIYMPSASRPHKNAGLILNLGFRTMYRVNLGIVPETLGFVPILNNHGLN